jgi:hypothetical protein
MLRLQPEAVVVEAVSEGAGEAAGAEADILAAAAEWQAGAMPVAALAGTAAVEAATSAAAWVAGTSAPLTAVSARAALHRR